ncbi:MAG: glutathione S-transferase, partial [Xanthomonadales bacterium]|nr:glutathione S-transferase [Xanthomonadales bacterium]
MQLVGYLDSPFVRRVAVSMRFLGIAYQHRELSIFRNYDEFRALHPSVKVPTLILDDGSKLIDSSLIIVHLEQYVAGRSLMPVDAADHARATERIGVATAAMEKVA